MLFGKTMGKHRRFDMGFLGISQTAAKLVKRCVSTKFVYIKNHKISFSQTHIWRSQVQALAGPRFYYSDLCFGVGRCFLLNLTRVNVMFVRENWQYYIKIRAKIFAVRFT